MKTRILSALVGLVLLGIVFAFLDTLLLNITMCVICVMAVIELLIATGCSKFKGLVALSMLMTAVIPFARWGYLRPVLFEVVYVLIIAFFLLLLWHNEAMGVGHLAMTFLFSTIVPVFYSCAVYLRDDKGALLGGFYLLVALGSAWLCDTGAYFTGRAFGRRKLAPKVSPKKTVEGAVGGVVFCTVLLLALSGAYEAAADWMGTPVRINYPTLAVCTPVFAVVGMLGDLSASVIKRQFGIKDFGNIMPGHGGILDRFDSVLFTLPAVYILSGHVSLITAI